MKKKLIALLAAVAMVFSLAACGSTPDSVGTIGTVDITSGLYLLAQYDAYQKAADLATSEQDATDVKAFLKQTITVDADSGETATVSDFVSQKTMENLETYAAIETRFEELGGQLTAEEETQADSYASQLMEQYDTLTCAFEESGWAYETSTATGTKKAPIVTTLESLRKDVLAYLSALGLTPAGAKKLDAAATAKAQEDPLIAALKNLGG